jgi:hypothetical protein
MGFDWRRWINKGKGWIHVLGEVAEDVAPLLVTVGLGKYAAIAGIIVSIIERVEQWSDLIPMSGEQKLDLAATVLATKVTDTVEAAADEKPLAAEAIQLVIDEAKKRA